jgi:predicted Zn-dependent peptidase
LFPDNPYKYGPIGKKEDLENLTVKDCQDFYNKYYAPNNATLVIAGDVEAEKAIKMVQERFGEIKPSKLDGRKDFEFISNKVKAVNKGVTDLPVPVTILSFYTEGARDKDRAALEVLLNCLTNGRSSRLWKSLINETKTAEFFAGESLEGSQKGVVILGAAHLPGLSKKVEKNIWKQLEEIKAKGLNESEFIKTRNQIRSGNVFEKYHAEQLAGSIGFEEVVRGDYTNFYRLDEEIAKVTQEDVIRVANRYFNKDNVKKIYFEPRHQILLVNLAGLIKSIF